MHKEAGQQLTVTLRKLNRMGMGVVVAVNAEHCA